MAGCVCGCPAKATVRSSLKRGVGEGASLYPVAGERPVGTAGRLAEDFTHRWQVCVHLLTPETRDVAFFGKKKKTSLQMLLN